MAFFTAMNISGTGLTAQRLRMEVISENIANINTTRTITGEPYRRKTVLFQEIQENTFETMLRNATGMDVAGRDAPLGHGVRVHSIVQDHAPGPMQYDPSHPDANEEGYVQMPNVNIVEEMVNMISASRSYEANITAINASKAMLARTLELARS